jgi:hypothetical protein
MKAFGFGYILYFKLWQTNPKAPGDSSARKNGD